MRTDADGDQNGDERDVQTLDDAETGLLAHLVDPKACVEQLCLSVWHRPSRASSVQAAGAV
jgi:hypothetical protein